MMGVFEYPYLLALAVLLPVFIATLLISAYRRRMRRLARLASAEVVGRLLPAGAIQRPGRRVVTLTLAALLVAIAFAGPRWGMVQTTMTGSGVDIVLAIDASLSMMAVDERPNRLEHVKQEIRRLRATSGGDRIGVIAFAGRSYILTPLTTDEGALDLFIENLDPSIVGQAGSAVSRAITQGTDLLLATQSSSDRALIIMSDWESFENEEEVISAATRAKTAGIHVIAVGFGTTAGARIPLDQGSRSQWKLDEQGRVVHSRHNAGLMRATAEAAGGAVIEASDTDKAARIRRALSSLRAQQRALDLGAERTARFQLFLLPALLLVLMDTFASERLLQLVRTALARPRARRTATTSLAAVLLLPMQPAGTSPDVVAQLLRDKRYREAAAVYRREVRRGDNSEQTLYNLGTVLLLADSLAGANRVLEGVSGSSNEELRYRALFNQGLAQLNAGLRAQGAERSEALTSAVEAYRNALLMRPDDMDAKWNYELALRENESGGGGSGPQQQRPSESDSRQDESQQSPDRSSLGRDQAEQILDNAARDERDVQARSQERNRPSRPPGGKDW